jgi:tetratricopeptide (TPR) repeat protein
LVLLLACGDSDTALVLKTIRDLEQADASDIFLLHADDFVRPGPFVSAAVNRLAEDLQRTNMALQNQQREPLPELPGSTLDESRPPAERLIEAVDFARSLLPSAQGHRLVWAMFPTKIADRDNYLRLILACTARDGIRPWMRGVRLIFRVPFEFALDESPLNGAPRLRLQLVDFGPQAMSASMQEEANDPKLPEAERMNALLGLATLDHAHDRIPDAVRRYQTLFAFAQKTENSAMQALVLNGLGDIAQKQGNVEIAQHWYECAIDPALTAGQPVVLATVVKNLATIAYQGQQFADAEVYYDNLSTLQTWLMDPVGRLQALEGRGLAQGKQAKAKPALASFEEAALLGIGFGLPDPAKRNLEHMRHVCRESRDSKKLAEVEAELSRTHL